LPDGYSPDDHKGTPMKLILDTLERARLAANFSDAITLADAIADLDALGDALTARGFELCDIPGALADLQALTDHARTQPFETTDMDDGTTLVESLTPDAFPHWLGELERLAS
jgi:hypothetical protein